MEAGAVEELGGKKGKTDPESSRNKWDCTSKDLIPELLLDHRAVLESSWQ